MSPCVCDALPECAPPSDFDAWCTGQGPGPFGAARCHDCPVTECEVQPGPLPDCLTDPLWCCTVDFNPAPQPTEFHCVGNVMCEVSPDVFEIVCDYDENVTALDPVEAALVLVAECNADHPGYKCGLWTLECSEVPQ